MYVIYAAAVREATPLTLHAYSPILRRLLHNALSGAHARVSPSSLGLCIKYALS